MSMINRILFIGSKPLGLRVLQEIYTLSPETLIGVLTIDDSDDTRSVFSDFQNFSNSNELKLHVAKNRKESERIIGELKPDLCLVVGWYWLIGNTTLDAVPFGFIGIHNSLLPKFRGGSPLIWSIICNEDTVGVSFFSFTPDMDDGPIWAQGRVSVENGDYISDVLKKLEDETIEVLRNTYPKILNGSVRSVEQDHQQATYCVLRFPCDGKIDWNKSAQDVYNFIRAQSHPYPGAFTYFDAQVLKIWKAKLFTKPYYGTPGQIARITSEGVYVIGGDNRAIILEEVELNGKRGKANDFIKSIKGRFSNTIEDAMTDVKASGVERPMGRD